MYVISKNEYANYDSLLFSSFKFYMYRCLTKVAIVEPTRKNNFLDFELETHI